MVFLYLGASQEGQVHEGAQGANETAEKAAKQDCQDSQRQEGHHNPQGTVGKKASQGLAKLELSQDVNDLGETIRDNCGRQEDGHESPGDKAPEAV
jgi:hypothetical protein